MVREEEAIALAAKVAMMLAAEGKNPVIVRGREPWLVRGAVMMLDAYGIGGCDTTEDGDAASR